MYYLPTINIIFGKNGMAGMLNPVFCSPACDRKRWFTCLVPLGTLAVNWDIWSWFYDRGSPECTRVGSSKKKSIFLNKKIGFFRFKNQVFPRFSIQKSSMEFLFTYIYTYPIYMEGSWGYRGNFLYRGGAPIAGCGR